MRTVPHFIVEYTDNIKTEARIPELLQAANRILAEEGYPVAGMRARAIELHDYVLADGKIDCSMVHAALKLAPGHTVEEKKHICGLLFEMMKSHFADIYARRGFLLSFELSEVFSADGPTLKWSNIAHLFAQV
jgi:5-carboxymethyl-2-hydroxymuconate isomerase